MLRRVHVRPRPFYNARHTYITQMLAMGVDALFVARQTGTSLEMIEKHYVKTSDIADELDELISDATAARTGNPASSRRQHRNRSKKTPEILGASSRAGDRGRT